MRNKLKASISLLLILILTIAFSIPALAETSVIPTGENKDPVMGETCTGFKIDEVENIKSDEPYTLINGDYHFIITKTTIDDVEYFDWTSNVPVTHIFVKGGNDGNLYTLDAPEMSGTALHAPVNSSGKYAGLSHITFYVCDDNDEAAPSINIEKLVSIDGGNTWHDADSPTGPTGSYPGTAKFKVIVTNTGNVALTDVKVTDTDFTFTGVASALAAGTVSTSDVKTVDTNLGQHTNTATVNAEYDGDAIAPDSDMAHYITYSTPHASIDIEKYVWNGEDFEDADTATGPHLMSDPVYKFVVKNTGNVTLDDIEFWDVPTISNFFDDQTLMDPFMLPETLAPNAGFTAYGTMDWEYGQQSDTAYVTGTPPEGMDVTDSDLAHYYGHEMTPRAAIDIEKLVSVDGGNTWHDADSPTGPTIRLPGTVRFKVIVTNTGTVDLTNIVVTDPDFEFTGVVTSLDAGDHDESNITAVPAERYQHTNTATVNAKYDGQPITPDSDKAHYYGDYERRDNDNDNPDISIKKYVSADGGTTWDDAENASGPIATYPGTVQFKVVIKNTGDYRLTDIEVTDTDFEFTGVASTLDEGDSDTSDIITVATIDGQHSNTAEVEGFYGSQKVTDSDKAHYYTNDGDNNINENGKISIHKFLDDNRNGIQDNQDFHIQNVTFELYAANKTEMLGSQKTDNEGNLTFTNLEFGTYYLEEKSEYDITTKGFDADGFMKITVNSNETVTIIVGNENENVIASDNVVIVEESVPLALPTTGEQPPTSMYILGGLIMLAGMFLKRFK
jgi:LPXTG-motif cell wall-anchored protein